MLQYLDLESLKVFNNLVEELQPTYNKIICLRNEIKKLKPEHSRAESFGGCGCISGILLAAILTSTIFGGNLSAFYIMAGLFGFLSLFLSGSFESIKKAGQLQNDLNTEDQIFKEKISKIYINAFKLDIYDNNLVEYIDGNLDINKLLAKSEISLPCQFTVYIENNQLILINNNYNYDYDKFKCIGKFIIPIDDIYAFTRIGDFYTKTNIKGGGSDYHKGLVGGLIAGETGAILASRTKISSSTSLVDQRNTILEIRTGDSIEDLIFSSSTYELFIKIMPSKELALVSSQFSTNLNAKDVISNTSDTKECPFCAEIIKYKAKICRFCNREISE